jgi:CPA2 family monovalent cation:H+ antiporter-2
MTHDMPLILTLAGGLCAALAFGFAAHKLRLSPIVGYLVAGIVVGPHSPGFVADSHIAAQFAEIGVILLMFGVGLHFHLSDLLAVRRVALPGALVQIASAMGLTAFLMRQFGWSWTAGLVLGAAVAVASTVVLTRVLADNRDLHTPTGHIAVGWLIVEDLFTIVALVMLPTLFGQPGAADVQGGEGGPGVWAALGVSMAKLAALVVFALVAGQRLLPRLLGYVARTGSRELFTLAVLALALGIAVGSAEFFGASMALGAFLAGMVVGQSDFGARAASDALPMRDAFAVLFFVSVGMLFDPSTAFSDLPFLAAMLGVVLAGKPLAALAVVLGMGRSVRSALVIAVALAQIGEFSFILGSLAVSLGVMPGQTVGVLVVTAIITITLNPLLYRGIAPVAGWLEKRGLGRTKRAAAPGGPPPPDEDAHRVIVIGFGPVGRTLVRILEDTGMEAVVVERNLDTVARLRDEGRPVVYGDAQMDEVLLSAGIEKARGLIIAAFDPGAGEIIATARRLRPDLRILTRANYLGEAEKLRQAGAYAAFAGEGEVALAMMSHLMHELGATDEQIDRERQRVREELF